MNIDSLNQAFKEVGEKVLGFKKRKKGEWIQEETWGKNKERSQALNELHPINVSMTS